MEPNIFSSPFFVQDLLIFLMGFGIGCVVASMFHVPRWLVEELTK